MRVLFLTHRLPFAPNRGDRIRAYHTLRVLRVAADVDLVSLAHDADEASHAGDLDGLVDSVVVARIPRVRTHLDALVSLGSRKAITHSLLYSPAVQPIVAQIIARRRPDVVYAYCSGMARFGLEPPLDRFPLVIDLVDVDSLKWDALASKAAPPLRWIYQREARRLSAFEAHAAQRAFATLVINEREHDSLRAIAPDARIEVVPAGVDLEYWRPRADPAADARVIFCGVMNYPPNAEGAKWVARSVWPLVRRQRPAATLSIVGANPIRAVKELDNAAAGIEVTGAVPDVRPFLARAAVAVAPLHVARGFQNKVLEAIASGLPVVTTSRVAEGLPPDVRAACLVADDADRFADAILECLEMAPADRRRKAAAVDLSDFTWERRLEALPALLDAAARSARR